MSLCYNKTFDCFHLFVIGINQKGHQNPPMETTPLEVTPKIVKDILQRKLMQYVHQKMFLRNVKLYNLSTVFLQVPDLPQGKSCGKRHIASKTSRVSNWLMSLDVNSAILWWKLSFCILLWSVLTIIKLFQRWV